MFYLVYAIVIFAVCISVVVFVSSCFFSHAMPTLVSFLTSPVVACDRGFVSVC